MFLHKTLSESSLKKTVNPVFTLAWESRALRPGEGRIGMDRGAFGLTVIVSRRGFLFVTMRSRFHLDWPSIRLGRGRILVFVHDVIR